MLTLFYAPGACSMAPHIVLEESGEKYTPRKVDLAKGEQRTPEHMKIHPMGRVPALLLDDGSPLTENTAILPYLGKRFGLWPKDPVKEAALDHRLFRRDGAPGERTHRPHRALHRREGRLPGHPGEGQAELRRVHEADRRDVRR
jgi:glutathione S-transferase